MLDLFNDKVVSVDYNRDQGFLTGMGIDVKDKKKNGDEAKTGKYSGGTYTIVCNEPTNGAQPDGKTAMERCLAKNPDINLVYTINEPAGAGRQRGAQGGRARRRPSCRSTAVARAWPRSSPASSTPRRSSTR